MSALVGLTVVDVSGTISTGYCGKLFADYGASVLNIEPDEGFPTRTLPPHTPTGGPGENSALHAYLSTRKQSIRRDALSPAQLSAILDTADLIVDDGAPQLALPDSISRMSISWYGRSGPMAEFSGSDAQVYAMNGMLRGIGPIEGPPYIPTGHQGQIVGGTTAFIGAMGHILSVELGQSQPGEVLETSILESVMCFTDVGAISSFNTGLESSRMGINRFPPTYPLGIFPCKDGWLGVTVLTPAPWHAFCDLLGMEDLSDVPLFQTSVGRLENLDLIEPRFSEALLSHNSEELFYRGQNARVPLARVPTMEALFSVDQFEQRNAFCTADLGHTQLTVPSNPFRLYKTPPSFGGSVALLGQDTAAYAT